LADGPCRQETPCNETISFHTPRLLAPRRVDTAEPFAVHLIETHPSNPLEANAIHQDPEAARKVPGFPRNVALPLARSGQPGEESVSTRCHISLASSNVFS